jgi:RNA polymerase sigma-70 factor (ECF subfamily)
MNEAELIAAARAGDESAFSELYNLHHRYVRAIGRSILPTDDLDDMCQETFLSAFTRLGSFEGNAQFRTWLSRIALNRCLMILRNKRRGGQGQSQTVGIDENPDHSGLCSVDKHLEGLPDRMYVEQLLLRLTPAQREALELAYVEEMSAAQIAAVLDTTVTAVKGRIAIARKKLRMMRDR